MTPRDPPVTSVGQQVKLHTTVLGQDAFEIAVDLHSAIAHDIVPYLARPTRVASLKGCRRDASSGRSGPDQVADASADLGMPVGV